MHARSLILAMALGPILPGAVTGCSDSTSDAGAVMAGSAATAPLERPAAAPAGATGSGAWPADLQLPAGMQVVGTPEANAGHTLAWLSCTGTATAALTSMTAMLNEAGYRTEWKLPGANGGNEPVTVEGTGSGRVVRATIHANQDGACERVAFSYGG